MYCWVDTLMQCTDQSTFKLVIHAIVCVIPLNLWMFHWPLCACTQSNVFNILTWPGLNSKDCPGQIKHYIGPASLVTHFADGVKELNTFFLTELIIEAAQEGDIVHSYLCWESHVKYRPSICNLSVVSWHQRVWIPSRQQCLGEWCKSGFASKTLHCNGMISFILFVV